MKVIKKLIEDILIALYQPFGFAAILAFLFMFLYLFAREHGWKSAFRQWWAACRSSSIFRRVFLLAFYTAMILFRTLLNREIWFNPLSDVIGVWGLHGVNGELTTEAVENLVLFTPFVLLLLWSCQEKIIGKEVRFGEVLWQSTKITFLFSLSVELLQLLLKLGTFQLSDLFYNTLGGMIGGIIYWVGYKVKHKKRTCQKYTIRRCGYRD